VTVAGLPELHEQDPRLCPGRDDYDQTVGELGEAPYWLGPAPFTTTHDFGDPVEPRHRCQWCFVTPEQVRDRFRDWRYEQLVEQLNQTLDRLGTKL
jgi:hypothetical protein